MYLLDYDCITAAGLGVDAFLAGLYTSQVHAKKVTEDTFAQFVTPGGLVCFLPSYLADSTLKNRCYHHLFKNCFKMLSERMAQKNSTKLKDNIHKKKVLCILSSTKGCAEDYVWNQNDLTSDPFFSLYDCVRDSLGLPHLQIMTVSNACSSSHVAIEVAQMFIRSQVYDYVYVVAFDFIGPFVYSGFQALKVLSHTQNKPFADDRDGLQLGEAMAILLFSNNSTAETFCKISQAASLVHPSSVTRPSTDGHSLLAVMEKTFTNTKQKPNFFLAHGTGTVFNDLTEDNAYSSLQKKYHMNVPITSTKWSVGHCLGASGAVDMIAAAEAIRRQKLFSIASTERVQEHFTNFYKIFSRDQESDVEKSESLQTGLVTSLGFGGVYAAITLEKIDREKSL